MNKFLLLLLLFSSALSFGQTKTVVVNPSKDTTIVSFEAVTTSTTTITSKVTVIPTVIPPFINVPPPVDTVVAGYALTYSTGYDAASDIFNSSNQAGNGSLSTIVFKTGPGSFKSVPANVSSGIRSEVQYSSATTPAEGAIEYDVMYETLFLDNGHSFQFHPNTQGGSASPGLWHINGKFDVVNWKGGQNIHHNTGFAIQTNKWYHIRFEYKFGAVGYWRTFIDGVLYGSWNGQVGDGSGQYLKIGVNMWQNQSSVVYYDNLKIYKKL